jgi:hypothetical protein
LVLYVDDLLITGSDIVHITALKRGLSLEFEMKDLGLMKKFLDVQIMQIPRGILMYQTDYAHTILNKYASSNQYPATVPLAPKFQLRRDTKTPLTDAKEYQALIGQFHYLTKTRPDLGYSTSLVSRFLHNPQLLHRRAAQNIVNYISRYPSFGLWYPRGEENILEGFSDANYAGDLDERKSTGAYLFTFGKTPISWSSKK